MFTINGGCRRSRSSERLLATLLLAGVLLTGAAISGCSSTTGWFFFPQQTLRLTPDALGLRYQDVSLTTPDGETLHSWYLPADAPAKGSLLFLHGNAENISTHITHVAWLPAQGYSVLLLGYRGYGRSTGQPQLPGLLTDIEMASRWLAEQAPPPYALLGQSMGAALAVSYLGQTSSAIASGPRSGAPFQAVILDAPFDSYGGIARQKLRSTVIGALISPVAALVPEQWDPIRHIAQLQQPKLFIASPHDRVVPMALTSRLFDAAAPPKQYLKHQGGHISAFGQPQNRRKLLEFLSRSLPPPAAEPIPRPGSKSAAMAE